ncbi:hypothetical protein COB11_03910, partial [Candidatus Aerophobetes bacterium]
IAAAILFTACSRNAENKNPKMICLQLIDRNGFNETIGSKDRLDLYKNTDFLEPQPYIKVVRIFQRNAKGKVLSAVTSYHENGEIAQYLEVESGRAHGIYKEWHPNGLQKVLAHVIEGLGDVSEDAMASWVFDNECIAFDEKGKMIAKIIYAKGELSKEALYYYPDGTLKKKVPFHKDEIHGEEVLFNEEGEMVGSIHFKKGLKDGVSEYLGSKSCPKFHEEYSEGKLLSGVYYNFDNNVISKVNVGNGLQTLYDEGLLCKQLEFKDGRQAGKVYHYSSNGALHSMYSLKEGEKHGEEWIYYVISSKPKQKKICFNWYEGKLQGRVKSWYPNGNLESERDVYNNKKNGPSTAWYINGNIMLIEEYENDTLVKGLYMKKSNNAPVSSIENGSGIATLYDKDGYFLKKVHYQKGSPIEE